MQQPFRRANLYVTLLLITEALIGVLMVAVTGYYHKVFTSYMSQVNCRMVHGYMFGVYIFAVQLMVSFLCSILMWRRLWKRRCTPNIRLLLDVWIFYSCVIIAAGFGCVWTFYRGITVLQNGAETSLLRGIDLYYSCPEWKLMWDSLQWNKDCCGVHSYKDWASADWMPPQDNCSNSVLTPYTCCKRSCESCFSHMQSGAAESTRSGNDRQQPFPALPVDSINTNGCLPVFDHEVWNYFYILLGLCIMSLKFLITICCLTKYILHRQNEGDACYNMGLNDEDGYPLVVVKCPANVRCVTISDEDLASDNAPEVKYCNCSEMDDEQCD